MSIYILDGKKVSKLSGGELPEIRGQKYAGKTNAQVAKEAPVK